MGDRCKSAPPFAYQPGSVKYEKGLRPLSEGQEVSIESFLISPEKYETIQEPVTSQKEMSPAEGPGASERGGIGD